MMKLFLCTSKSICHNKIIKKSGVYCKTSDSKCDGGFQHTEKNPPINFYGILPEREDYKQKHFYKRK